MEPIKKTWAAFLSAHRTEMNSIKEGLCDYLGIPRNRLIFFAELLRIVWRK